MDIRKFFGGGKAVSVKESKNKDDPGSCSVKKETSKSSKVSTRSKKMGSINSKHLLKSSKTVSSIDEDNEKLKTSNSKAPQLPEDAKKQSSSENDKVSIIKSRKIDQKRPRKEKECSKRKHDSDTSEDEVIWPSKRTKCLKIMGSDSDEDVSTSLVPNVEDVCKTNKDLNQNSEPFTKVIPKPSSAFSSHEQKVQKNKPVVASDFFGCSPIQRSESRRFVENVSAVSVAVEKGTIESPSLSKKVSVKRKRNAESPIEEPRNKKFLMNAEMVKCGGDGQNEHSSPCELPNVDDLAQSAKKDEDRRKSYLAFRNREPPRALGSKEIPKAEDNCLEGLTFVLTGVCESIDRDECKSLIEKYGGKVTTNVSRNTKYLVVGRDAGASKLAKAKELKTKRIDEDGLFDLLKTLPRKRSKYEIEAEKKFDLESKKDLSSTEILSIKPKQKENKISKREIVTILESPRASLKSSKPRISESFPKVTESHSSEEKNLLWVDKYKPASMKNIIGQQGDRSQAKKLFNWLMNWHKNLNKKPIWGRQSEDGSEFKAALLSGPPGIGKTTTAHLVCQESGFSFFELNASDTRSKGSLKEVVSEALNCHSLFGFVNVCTGKKVGFLDGKKHCLVMDEVDGMAGNEDRGGIQEVIQLIKSSHIPIICMCNDRNHPKVRSLANYCFDLRFSRPRKEQIKASMMSIAFKEGIKIPPSALDEIILAANQDIRQVIHNLSMWSAKDKVLTYEQLKKDATRAQKDLHFSPFDVCRKVFSGSDDTRKMTLNDKSDLFFHDYNIAPLFVQENYLAVRPYNAQFDTWKHLNLLGKAASSISMGDLVDGHIRKNQQWGLLPTQAMFASVIPGENMRGTMSNSINFPVWLGKNSTSNKNKRLLQELTLHAFLTTSCGKQSLNLDYLSSLKQLMTTPLIKEGSAGVMNVLSVMSAYNLLREDFDNVVELSSWTGGTNQMAQIDSKVKRAFTCAYNKAGHMMPYSSIVVKKSRGGAGGSIEDFDDDEEIQAEVEEENDVAGDAMIMAKQASKSGTKSSSSKSSVTKKEKPSQKKSRK